jgi:hypothetical protein
MELVEQLYLALKSYPCRCQYQRTRDQKWVWAPGPSGELERVLEVKCSMHLAIERYELERGVIDDQV